MTLSPYYSCGSVLLYHGDCREILPRLSVKPDSCVADPPYVETRAAWDRWPTGWVSAVSDVLPATASLWCFGSARMWLDHPERIAEFRMSGWKYAQEALWVKRNGSGPTDRTRLVRVHEWAYQWYRGRWTELPHDWERVPHDGARRGSAVRRAIDHRGTYDDSEWVDDGTRQPRSVTYVIEAPSVRYQKRHPDEKPLDVVTPLVRESTPPGGLVMDPVAGACTTGITAINLGLAAILIERNERFCESGAIRLSEHHAEREAAS